MDNRLRFFLQKGQIAFVAVKWVGKKVGSGVKWVWKKVAKSPTKIAKPVSEISDKKIEHIMVKKHDWKKVVNNEDEWKQVSKVVSKVITKEKRVLINHQRGRKL